MSLAISVIVKRRRNNGRERMLLRRTHTLVLVLFSYYNWHCRIAGGDSLSITTIFKTRICLWIPRIKIMAVAPNDRKSIEDFVGINEVDDFQFWNAERVGKGKQGVFDYATSVWTTPRCRVQRGSDVASTSLSLHAMYRTGVARNWSFFRWTLCWKDPRSLESQKICCLLWELQRRQKNGFVCSFH